MKWLDLALDLRTMLAAATSLYARTNLSQNYVTFQPSQVSSPPIPSGSGARLVLPVTPPAPQVRVRRPISD